MRRRALLTALAVPLSGCLSDGGETTDRDTTDRADRGSTDDSGERDDDSTDGDDSDPACTDASIDRAQIEVEYWCDTGSGKSVDASGTAEGCDGDVALEIVEDGDVVWSWTTEPTDSGRWSMNVDTSEGGTPSPGEATLWLRGPEGVVVAEATAPVDHYLDDPAPFLGHPSLDPEQAVVGEPVTISVAVGNGGAATDYEVALLVDGEAVETQRGAVPEAFDCTSRSGGDHEFTHAFESPGEYDLAVDLDPEAGDGHRREVGTVTVEEREKSG